MTNKLEKLRDKMASAHYKENIEADENTRRNNLFDRFHPRWSGFCYGFDAAASYFLKREAVMREALETILYAYECGNEVEVLIRKTLSKLDEDL